MKEKLFIIDRVVLFSTVRDVLPLLLHANTDLPSKQLYRFLHKSTEFYLASLMSKDFHKVSYFCVIDDFAFLISPLCLSIFQMKNVEML